METEVVTQQATGESNSALAEGLASLNAAATQLERAATAIEARISGDVAKMVATVENDPSARLAELEMKLQAVEQQLAELRATTNVQAAAGRKTLPVAASHLLAKHGIDTLEQVNGGALDAALNGLSLEQRIAVKSQLIRAGLLGQ